MILFLIALAIAMLTAGLEGWALHLLWGTYLTPELGIAAPSIAACAVMSIMLGLATGIPWSGQNAEPGELLKRLFVFVLVRPLTALVGAWLLWEVLA